MWANLLWRVWRVARFAIIVAGFPPKDQSVYQQLHSQRISTPSMHVMGETDKLIAVERSMGLASAFLEPLVVTHPGGHMIPSNAVFRKHLKQFVSRFVAGSEASESTS